MMSEKTIVKSKRELKIQDLAEKYLDISDLDFVRTNGKPTSKNIKLFKISDVLMAMDDAYRAGAQIVRNELNAN